LKRKRARKNERRKWEGNESGERERKSATTNKPHIPQQTTPKKQKKKKKKKARKKESGNKGRNCTTGVFGWLASWLGHESRLTYRG
jgi:hypothetical protein